jgi:predicted nucleic acid-binding protein
MRLFLDTSVLLAACGSAKGASRYLCENGADHGWILLSSCYCLTETLRNLPKLGADAAVAWENIVSPGLDLVPDSFALDKALVFPKTKDRPVVITALASQSAVLLTLDRMDFHRVLGTEVYGMAVRTPAEFLIEQRRIGAI